MNIPAPENHTDVASGDTSQPARKRNIEALTAFFRSGIKPAGSHGKLGIELEQRPFSEAASSPLDRTGN